MAAVLVIAACTNDSKDTAGSAASTTSTTTADTVAPATSATSAGETTTVPSGYSADITRTEYGVAHIVADDWGSLGFGQGYAFAQDRACTLIDQVLKVRGERARWFGAGDNNENVDSDFAYRHLGLIDDADERFGDQPENITEMVAGYVAGFDSELDTEGPHGWCEGEEWVQPITTTDLYAYLNDVLLFASSGVLIQPIATATPPEPGAETTTSSSAAAESTVDLGLRADVASNGWAIGSSLSEGGGGVLLANPHFPWEGEKRLWESQLTLTTGELDVYGATLSGVPGVLIGFNHDVAWTHTVSAGYRMTLYELTLVPGDPTTYMYGDTTKEMTSTDITIDVRGEDGTISPVTRTMWSSHYGPMLNLPFGWTADKAYTMRDANIDNNDVLEQFFGMDSATSMDEFIDVHRTFDGIPWVNTIATSSNGRAWYADTAATPDLSAEAIAQWQAAVASGGLAKVVLDNGAILLDGSNPINEWVDDPSATRPGILPFDQQPQLERDDFVFNANDSHWLANPDELLTGYSPLTGAEAVPQSPRTRENVMLLTDPTIRGGDGKLSLTEVQDAIFSNRGLPSDLLLPSVLAACDRTETVLLDGQPYDLINACNTLRGWSGRYDVDAQGAALWREFIGLFGYAAWVNAGDLYSVPFDPADPVGTPNTLNADDQQVLAKLAQADKGLTDAGFSPGAPLGDLQFDGRTVNERIPLPAGNFSDGTASVVGCCAGSLTSAPEGDPGTFSDTFAFSDKGYPITDGDSFILTVAFGPDGPHAEALLTYGQPDDPTDPGFTSQTKLFSDGTFRAVRFSDAEIESDPGAKTQTVTGPRD